MENNKCINRNSSTISKWIKNMMVFSLASITFIQCKEEKKKASAIETKSTLAKEEVTVVRQAAEFEPQEAVWIIWSPVDHKQELSNEKVTLKVIESLVSDTKVMVTAQNDSLYNRALSMIPKNLLEDKKVEVKIIPSEELWVRDMGPNFVELSNGKKGIIDFNFDAWGYTPHDQMDDYTIRMEKYDEKIGELLGLEVISSDLYSEGGNREVNGKGTLMVVETVELNRNLEKTKEEIEYKKVLGVSNIIWLKEGVYEDDHTFNGPIDIEGGKKAYTVVTTGGHIDEFARFVNPTTILLADVPDEDLHDPIAVENKKRLDVNYEILKKAVDQDGKPFNIIRVPTPKTILSTMKPGDSVYDFISTLEYLDGSK
ncbi:MAG: agmatine/peptidylarginine deiminase, partial [Flavobacteriales bacterium]